MLKAYQNWFKKNLLSRWSWLGLVGMLSCCTLVFVFGLMLFPKSSQRAYAAPDPGPIAPSVGISLPATIAFDAVTPTAAGSTTTATASLTVTTAYSDSYSLYLYSSDGDNSLKSINPANTSTVDAITGGVGLTLSSLEPNTWGYNLGTAAPTADTTYNAVPTSNATPIQTKDTSSTNSANDTYTLSFGAKVDTSIPSGTYASTLTVAVVAGPTFVTVAFDGNGATGGSMSPIKIHAGGSQDLPSNNFTRTGYIFNGWNTASDGSGSSYADGDVFMTVASQMGRIITLYAQWEEKTYYIQDFTNSQCQSLASENDFTVIDKRDGNDYTVRYIDGVCWMTQNLRIAGGAQLTPADSNIASNYTIPNTPFNWGGENSLDEQIEYSGNATTGYLYNLCAASAGTKCGWYGEADVINDICPAGWRLPSYDDFNYIVSDTLLHPLFALPAEADYTYAIQIDMLGWAMRLDWSVAWWSSTSGSSDISQYQLWYYYNGDLQLSDGLISADTTNKGDGLYMRCIRSS